MLSSLLCQDSLPKNLYFFDFSIAPSLMMYSYMPAIIASFLIGIFVMIKSKFSLQGKLLFAISMSFSVWVFNYLIQWTIAYVMPDFFSWQLTPIFMLLMFLFSAYFVYVFLEKKDASLSLKFFASLIFLPIILLLPSRFNIEYFNLTDCEGVYGNLWKYIYSIEAFIIIAIIFLGLKKYVEIKKDKHFKREVLFLTIGVASFLLISWVSDVLGEWTKQYQLNFIGPIGMVIFIGLLSFLIVKYKTFNIKLLGAQALVVALVILIASEFFFIPFDNVTNVVLISFTVLLAVIFGIWLIDSIKKEVERKEELQHMADKLAEANDQLRKLDNAKTEFISIASHQLRTPITAIKGFSSLLLEGSYGEVSEKVQGAIERIYVSTERLVNLIEDLLNVSRIESGRLTFNFENSSIEKLLKELYENFMLVAKNKKFYLDLKLPKDPLPEIKMDYQKVRELASNFIDNALKYTEKGGVTISAEIKENGVVIDEKGFVVPNQKSPYGKVVRITVSDTGIGIPKEEIPYLFRKFSRGKDTSRLHVGGTGLGLYVGKAIADAHHGQTWVESDGTGKGSRFMIEIPLDAGEEK